ncbi:MAG: hypothetical protein WAK53_07245 [Chromatiaceae bacterium]
MDRKIILGVVGAALLGFFAVLLLIPPTIDDGEVRLPWRTATNAAGQTQVFGFTLGETSLAEVRELFGQEGTINLFETPGRPERYGVEVYFEQVYLQSLRADFVITLDVDQSTLGAMYERGLRISQLGSGSKKIKLDPVDVEALLPRPIRSITYLPQARLDEPLIERRFGTPAERRTEPETGIVHWLYPERGIDIARDPKGKVVIQYVSQSDVAQLLAPFGER